MFTAKDYLHQVEHLMPRGPAWLSRKGSTLDALKYALARECARADVRASQVLDENDPRTASETLQQWFFDYDVPSECLTAFSDGYIGLEELRSELLTKIAAHSGLTKEFFESLAGVFGYDAEVRTFPEHNVGSDVNAAFYDASWISTFVLNVNVRGESGYRQFTVNDDCGMPLATWGNAVLECTIRSLAPAESNVIFTYEE